MVFKLKYGFVLLACVMGFSAFSQSFTATVNKNSVSVGEQVKLTYTVNANGSNFRLPAFANFNVLSGPHQSNSMQIVNGQRSTSIAFSFILSPVKEGSFDLPIASIDVNGKTLKSNKITMRVVKPSEAQMQQAQQQQRQKQEREKQLKENIYLKLFLSKNKVYQGEQIIATFKLYTRLQVVNYGFEKAPAFTGFYTQEINSKDLGQGRTEIINGVQYTTAIIKKVVLSPQRNGSIKIEPTSMEVIARVRDDRAARSLFDQFLGGYKDVEINLKSNGATIQVSALPKQGKPASFNGAVGSYTMKSSIDKQEVNTNDAINLKIEIAGSGNIKLIKDPNIEFPPDFEVYDPKEKSNLNVTSNGASGSKSFEYLIIPRHSGDFVIPAVNFSFFDTKTKTYKTLSTEEYAIKVNRSEGEEESASAIRPTRQKDVALLNKDIRYIHTRQPQLQEAGTVFFGSLWFWIGILSSSFLFSGLLFARKRFSEMQSDVIGMKRKKANKIASKYLNTAKQHLSKQEKNEFYEAIFRSLYNYLSMKLNIPASDLDKEKIAERLQHAQIEHTLIQEFIDILGECEMARYAPSTVMNEQELFDKTTMVIQRLEGGLK